MTMTKQEIQEGEQEVDISNMMLLAGVCCEELEKIHLDHHQEVICESFTRKKRSKLNQIKKYHSSLENFQYQQTCKETIATTAAKPSKKNNGKRKREDVPNNNKKKVKVEKPTSTPAWVEQLTRAHLQNSQPAIWICDKVVTASDANEGLNRFFIPKENSRDYLLPALTPQEQGMLRKGIPVKGLDMKGEVWNLELKYWPSIDFYIFQKEWIKLVKNNEFEADEDTIQIWLCRPRGEYEVHEKLCFLIGKKGE